MRDQTVLQKSHQRDKYPDCPPCKIVKTILNWTREELRDQLTWMCLVSYVHTLYRGHGHLQGHVFPGGLEIRIRVITITSITNYYFITTQLPWLVSLASLVCYMDCGSVVEFPLCNLWTPVRSKVVEIWVYIYIYIYIYTADETETVVQCFCMSCASIFRIFWSW